MKSPLLPAGRNKGRGLALLPFIYGNKPYSRDSAVPFRGSNFNNTSNGGVGALNLNNARSNSNNNIGFRSASPHFAR